MEILEQYGFVSTKVVKKKIAVIDTKTGEKHDTEVYVKPLSFASATEDLKAFGCSESEAVARRIADSICDKEGKSLFTVSQIDGSTGTALSAPLTLELLRVIGEVNHLGKTQN